MKTYKPWNPNASFLLPPSPRDWLPEDHLVYFILDVLGQLDLSAIESTVQRKDHRGARSYAPAMMVGLLLYGYCVGVFSSRKLEKATHEDVAFRVLSGGCHPDHTRISEFRRVHLEALRGLFLQVLQLCQKAGLVRLGHVAFDGTKMPANASKHKAMSYKRMLEEELRLKKEIEALLSRAEEADKAEDDRYGENVRGDELPEELRRRETRLERIRKARAELEEEAKQARAQALEDQVRRARERSANHPDPSERKRAATVADKKEAQAKEMRGDDNDDPPPFITPDGLPMHQPKATKDGTPRDKAQRNFTDPDSRIMESGGSFEQGYNCQAGVDAEHQVIVSQAVSNQPPDNGNLPPMMQQTVDNCGEAPDAASADAGYWAPGISRAATVLGIALYVSTARRKHGTAEEPVPDGPPPDEADERERMRHKLRTADGRDIYARRKAIVEPVFGQIKEAQGFRRFLLRGMEKVSGEWALVCTSHNLLKLFRATIKAAEFTSDAAGTSRRLLSRLFRHLTRPETTLKIDKTVYSGRDKMSCAWAAQTPSAHFNGTAVVVGWGKILFATGS